MTRILGLAGKAGSGKDYVCEGLSKWLLTSRVAFADGVRKEVAEAHPEMDVWTKPYPDEVRAMLQWWGTEYRRAEDPLYWVKKGIEAIEEAAEYAELVVVTDVRFANEAEAIRGIGGFVAEVHASDATRASRLGGKLPPAHESEVIDFRTDAVILNDFYPYFPPALNEFFGTPEGFQPFHPLRLENK